MTILVTGATGAVGQHIVRSLSDAGESVRALSRQPASASLPAGVEVVSADLSDASTLTPALFDGVDRVFVFPATTGVDNLADAAIAATSPSFVVLSSLAAALEFPRDVGSASAVHHAAVETAVTSRTDDWRIVRPGTFANNLLSWAWTIRSGAPIRAPFLDSAQAPIHEADVADVAVALLTGKGAAGEILPITGPEALTRREQIAAIARGLGVELKAEEISADEFRDEFGAFISDDIMAMLLAYWRDTVETPDVVRSVERITGRPGRSLEQWASDHRADLLG